MENKIKLPCIILFCSLLTVVSCESQQRSYASPAGYDLNNPKRYRMPVVLNEISGIAFHKGLSDTIYAEQDEEGKVFHFKPGSDQIIRTRFDRKGDFEDISICNDFVIMLRSDGVLYSFPFSETVRPEATQVKIFRGLLPGGEYEGLASLDSVGKVYVLCKHCTNEKTSKWGGGSIFVLNDKGDLLPAGSFDINIKKMEAVTGIRKINFHPSALAFNRNTREWYILSSVNHVLVILDEEWNIKTVYPLNPSIFPQPEGIAFDRNQNLYISNERNITPAATILEFDYQRGK
jgi:SdiA-regulated